MNTSHPLPHTVSASPPTSSTQTPTRTQSLVTTTQVLLGGVAFAIGFVALIAVLDPWLARFTLLPDQGAWWYYWKLPQPTFWGRLTAWGGYLAHQVAFWALIYYAQTRVKKYTAGVHPINLIALGVNAGFIGLHLVQTQLWYDGLAQDFSAATSQWSVIVMLVWILLMENKRRGLFFGTPMPLGKSVMEFARRYHGYVFAWATVYTFWFHPMVNTPGHLLGFFYMFMLLLQGSVFLTRLHVNRWWMVTQELLVLVHGAVVAYFQGGNIWPMFVFGFGGLFIITQMHGLGLQTWLKWALVLGYSAAVLVVYGQLGFAQLPLILAIPATEYGAVLVLALLISAGLTVRRWWPKPALSSE